MPATQKTETNHDRKKEPILVIDDEGPIRQMVTACLATLGYRSDAVATAGEASTRLQQAPYRLVILDLLLPDTVGFEFLVTLKRDYPQVPVLILTGMDYEEDIMEAALTAGANGFVSKLDSIENFVSEFNRVLRGSCAAYPSN